MPGDGRRDVEGKVYVEIGFSKINVGTWDGPSSRDRNADEYEYDFPKILAGLKVPVSGHHSEPGINCSGRIVVQLDAGSKLANPILVGSLVLTVIAGLVVGLVLGKWAPFRREPAPAAVPAPPDVSAFTGTPPEVPPPPSGDPIVPPPAPPSHSQGDDAAT